MIPLKLKYGYYFHVVISGIHPGGSQTNTFCMFWTCFSQPLWSTRKLNACTANKLASVPRPDNLKGDHYFTHSFSWCQIHCGEYWKEDKRRMHVLQDRMPASDTEEMKSGRVSGGGKESLMIPSYLTNMLVPVQLCLPGSLTWNMRCLCLPEGPVMHSSTSRPGFVILWSNQWFNNFFTWLFLRVGWEEEEILSKRTEELLKVFSLCRLKSAVSLAGHLDQGLCFRSHPR